MTTETDEQQVKEFLKRAEVRTMRKDLQKLREFDALKERDKIANVKTIEEQQMDAVKKDEEAKQKIQQDIEKQKREKILGKNTEKEREAEKDLKKYANESEKQQIFLLEAQRIDLENQAKLIESEREPQLTRQKNKTLSEITVQEIKLKNIVETEKGLEDELKYITEKEGLSNIPSEKKGLEERRSELENQRQAVEKKRWQIEKDLAELANRVKNIDQSFETATTEKNDLQKKIKEVDASLRAIYSTVMSAEEEKRRGQQSAQKISAEETAKTHAEMNEKIQREQWSGIPVPVKSKAFLKEAPDALKARLEKSAEGEEEQRKKFIQTIDEQVKKENK